MIGVYLVTDPKYGRDRGMEFLVVEAAKAGVACVQLREKNSSTRDFVDLAIRIKAALEPFRVPLIINDRIDVALAAGADGVHIGQSDMPYLQARRLLGPDAIIGLSVETWEDVLAAQAMDVNYLGISPVYPTPTKTDTKEPWGLAGVARIRAYSRHKLVAIGGINADNAAEIIRAGAHCVAVVSAICGAHNPFQATEDLNRTVATALAAKGE
jgi:thiamine-phosphate pyrophosphorylase